MAINNYNKIIDEIRFVNSLKFKEIDIVVAIERKKSITSKDRGSMIKTLSYVKGVLAPIKIKVKETKRSLNKKFKKILSEKQYKKWQKYQSKEEKKLNPNQASSQNYNQHTQKGTMKKGNTKGNRNSF